MVVYEDGGKIEAWIMKLGAPKPYGVMVRIHALYQAGKRVEK